MLIQIEPEELAIGMYVHAIDLPWHKHPFWRRRFLLRTKADLEKLYEARPRQITIDLARGAAPERSEPDAVASAKASPARQIASKRPRVSGSQYLPMARAEQSQSGRPLTGKERASELRRATKMLNKSKVQVTQLFQDARLGRAIKPAKIGTLVDQISSSVAKDASIILNVARLKTKDEYTYLHSVAVCALMINFGRKLGLDEATVRELGMAGMLHDVGKMSIPDAILNKPGKLDDAEFDIVREHTIKGHAMLSASKSIGKTTLDICLLHHEKMDGTGYPRKLGADDLSLPVRMSAICDVYDAITSQRSYNRPYSGAQALQKMLTWHGHFDQLLLRSFIESLGIAPLGSIVRLNGQRLAVIIGEDPTDYALPVVRVFYCVDRAMPLAYHDIQICREKPEDRVEAIEFNLPDHLQKLAAAAMPTQN